MAKEPQGWHRHFWGSFGLTGAGLSRAHQKRPAERTASPEHRGDAENGSQRPMLLKQHPQYSLKKVHLTETTCKNDLRVVWAPFQSRENPTERGKNVFQKRNSGSSKGEKMNIFTNHRAFSSGWFIKWVVLFLLSLQATTELFNELQLTMLFLKHLGHLWWRKTEGEGK